MKIIDFLQNDLHLTTFFICCLCVVLLLLCIAIFCLVIGVVSHKPYNNSKISYHFCHYFIVLAQIAWIIVIIALVVEFIMNFVFILSGKVSAIEFLLKFIIYLAFMAGMVDLAIRIFSNDGRYVGHVTPYEKFARFMKPIFWED